MFAHAVKVGGDHPVSSATPVSTLKHQDEEDGVPEKGKGARLHRAMDCLALMFFVVIAIVIREIIYGPGHALQNGGSNRNVVGEKSVAVGTGIAVQTTNLLEGKDSEAASSGSMTERPNIVVIFIDDQGFNDMGPRSTDMSDLTPHISKLGAEGLWLTNYYSESICTPARAALMTGRYPLHIGMQHSFISGNDPWGLPAEVSVLPQYLKEVGNYSTHIVGKWHLGHFTKSRTPLRRGFDSFYGYFSGFEGYFSHTAESMFCKEEVDCYSDLRDNEHTVVSDEYNAYLFMKKARTVIRTHASKTNDERTEEPMFLYYAVGNVHMPNEVPSEVMEAQADRLSHIPYHERRVFGAMTIILDDAVGEVVADLKTNSLYDETLIVIASDNGANPLSGSSGSNWPLRGMKGEYFEGGVKVHALVRSPLLSKELRGTAYNGLFHVTDWLPTIIGGALGRSDIIADGSFDGINHWHSMHTGSKVSPRTALVHNVDLVNIFSNTTYVQGAIRIGDYKLLVNVEPSKVYLVPDSNNPEVAAEEEAAQTSISTNSPQDFLFDIANDPAEATDLKFSMPAVYEHMMAAFDAAAKKAVTPAYCGIGDNKDAVPVFRDTGFIGPWRDDDVDYMSECFPLNSVEERDHLLETYCMYKLFPPADCAKLLHDKKS